MGTPYDYRKEWQEKKEKTKEFLKKEWLVLVAVIIIAVISLLKQNVQIPISVRILLGLVFLLFLFLIAVLFSAGSSVFIGKKDGPEETTEKGVYFGGIIRNVPANMIWVLRRSILGSDIVTRTGYAGKKEGIRFKIPFYHEDLGLVNLSPIPRDPPMITVNTKDNQPATLDWRIETFIPNGKSAIDFAVKVRENRIEFEDKKTTVIINQRCARENQVDLTHFKDDELKKMGKEVTRRFNNEVKDLGIQARAIEIKKILPPEEVRDTAEYATVSKQRRKIAKDKGAELKTIIDLTKADASKVVIADITRGALVDLVESISSAFGKKKEE